MGEVDIRKAGLRGALPAQKLDMGTLRDYMKGVLPTPPKSFDYGPLVKNYPMADNDRLGCCTVSGVVHLLQVAYAEIGEIFTYPGDADVQSTYFGLTGGKDTGCVETQVLKTWQTAGLFDTKIAAYCPVNPKDDAEMAAACFLFGGVYLGVEMPESAESQFENHEPWHLTIPRGRPVGGHCVVATGVNRAGIDLITWGAETTMTWDWWEHYGSEAYVVVPEVFVEIDHGPIVKLDITALEADLKDL